MATYIHYERYCPSCKQYFKEKRLTCPKCRGELKTVNRWYVTFRAVEYGKYKQKKLGAYTSKKEAERAYMEYESGIKRRENPIGITFGEICDEVLRQIRGELNIKPRFILFRLISPLFTAFYARFGSFFLALKKSRFIFCC